ncbi:MAG: hypothetical protein CML06_18035 [Pseudomonadales bacterium]|nr:hypothetical protein [Pseudomonadales bacterium]
MLKPDFTKLKQSHETFIFVVDALMLLLITINLIWIIFDTLFTSEFIRSAMAWVVPGFVAYYGEHVHPDFVTYDLIFVSIFLFEFGVRWVVAIARNTYHRWFFYPFVHWYDLIGCIPVGSFRWLRLLRVFSIVYRLQKYGIIDLRQTAVGQFFIKYYNVLVEEVSDRVVENVLDGVQDEVRHGSPVIERILMDVLIPKKAVIANWLTVKINQICDQVYVPHQLSLREYIDQSIAASISRDAKVVALEAVPVVGPKLVEVIDETVSNIVYDIVNGLLLDVGREETDHIVSELLDGVIQRILEPTQSFNEASRELVLDSIDIIKDQVRVKRWRLEAEG